MTEQHRTALKELQKLDLKIRETQERIAEFDPQFADVEEPALVLEGEVAASRKRLQEMRLDERRVELGIEEKRSRRQRLDERLGMVRNLREEAAVSAELEMVKHGQASDEQEAFMLIDQIVKTEERLAELEAAFAEAQAVFEPARQELLDARDKKKRLLESLVEERAAYAAGIDPREIKIYDAIRSNGRSIAVSELTSDGACGNCFGMIPLQLTNEIRHGGRLIRCEGCGVILAAPDPEAPEQAVPVAVAAPVAAEGGDDEDDAAADNGDQEEE